MDALCTMITDAPEFLVKHVDSVIPQLLKLTTYKPAMRGSSIQEVTDWLLFTEGADFSPAVFAGACVPARPCDPTLQTPGSQITGGRAGRQETTGQAGGCES
uniref:Uncharacterized protein n=1 Tax=Magallana gigas TaxID=29159 RepID=K1PG69_MAGGI